MQLHTYIRQFEPQFPVRGQKKASVAFSADWELTSSEFCLELVLLLSYMKTLHGCYGLQPQNGSYVDWTQYRILVA